jgi:hypothetical protein
VKIDALTGTVTAVGSTGLQSVHGMTSATP